MMRISVITVFPELYDSFLKTSLIARACDRGMLDVGLFRVADFCEPKERIDAATIGHGPGMILKPEVMERALSSVVAQRGDGVVVFFTPQGVQLTQTVIRELGAKFGLSGQAAKPEEGALRENGGHFIIICSRYEGVDARFEEKYADLCLSIGDYVLMGGDLPAQVFIEAISRLMPEVVGNESSVVEDSYETPYLDHDQFALPATWQGREVPEILRSGNHAAIAQWRKNNALKKTLLKRFDWLRKHPAVYNDREAVMQAIPSHYVVLMHDEVMVKTATGIEEGTSSVTSIDIHDIARSSSSYGIKKFFIVTSLADQQAIVQQFLSFWQSSVGEKYNSCRSSAVGRVVLLKSLAEVKAAIEAEEGSAPVLVTTSARRSEKGNTIDFYSQGLVWKKNRPVLLVFGTAQGLSSRLVAEADYLLIPIQGFVDFNHLSVRSAVTVVLDRWMGYSPRILSEMHIDKREKRG